MRYLGLGMDELPRYCGIGKAAEGASLESADDDDDCCCLSLRMLCFLVDGLLMICCPFAGTQRVRFRFAVSLMWPTSVRADWRIHAWCRFAVQLVPIHRIADVECVCARACVRACMLACACMCVCNTHGTCMA